MIRKGERTKQFIIEKSAPIFNKKGFTGTSITDLMEATNLTKGCLYNNFGSKDEIALRSLDYSLNKVKEALRARVADEKTATGRLNAMLDFFRNYSISPVIDGGCPLLNSAIDTDDTYPFLKQRASKGLAEFLGALQKTIAVGVAAGELRADLDPAMEAEFMVATLEGGIMMSKLNDNPSILNRLLDRMKNKIKLMHT